MNNEFLKKTLVFISCLIFLEDKENIGSGFKITENENVSYFKLLSRNKEQSFERFEGDFLDFKWDNNDFKLGFYFKEDLKICIFDEEKTECWEIVYEKELNLSNFDSFFNINVSFFDQDMSNNNEKIVIKNDLNKIIGRSNCGIEWDIENEDLDEFEDAENSEDTEDGYSSSASEIGDDSIDLSEMVNALDNSCIQLKTTGRASFKESLRGVKSRLEPIYECPVFEDASDYKNKHELFVDLKDNLEKSQNYFFRTLNKEHVLDFTDEIPMNNDLLEDYTLITLYSSQYITNGYKTVKKENDEVVIQEMQKKLGQEEPKKPIKTKDKRKFMDVNKTKIKETQRYVFVRKTNGNGEKTSLRKKTGKCLNNVQVYLSYFSKKQSFKYKPKYKRPFPSKVLDFSVCGYDKYYFTYNSPVITFVKENYNVFGDYSRITVKRKSFILNPRVYLMVRLLFIDKVFIDKKQWDFLLLAVQLIFDEIKKIKFVLKGKSGYLKRLKRTILRIEAVFNYEKSDKIFYIFFDSLFCKKIKGNGKSFFIKEKINGRVLKFLCKELDEMNVLPPCFIDRVFKALEIVTEKRL